jgi:hypothetical protein
MHGLHLVVADIEAARAALTGRGMGVSEIFHFEVGRKCPVPIPSAATTARSSRSATQMATAGSSRRSGDRRPGYDGDDEASRRSAGRAGRR